MVVILAGGYYFFFLRNSETEMENQPAKTIVSAEIGDISKTIKISGTAELVNEQNLRFNQAGKIAAVYFKAGDEVKKDDIIAELDKADLENSIRQAEISLENSRLSLQSLLKGDAEVSILKSKNSIASLESQIASAEKNLEISKKNRDNSFAEWNREISSAEQEVQDKMRSLETAQQNLENAKTFEDQDLETAANDRTKIIENTRAALKSALVDADTILAKIDGILGVEENTKRDNDSYEYYLGFYTPETKTLATDAYSIARKGVRELRTATETLEALDEDGLIAVLDSATETLALVTTAADKTYVMLQASLSGTNLSESSLDSLKSSISSARSSGQNAQTTFQNSIISLKNLESADITETRSSETIRQKEDAVKSAETALQKSQESLQNLTDALATKQESKNLEITNAEDSLRTLSSSLVAEKASLADLEQGATSEEIARSRNDVTQKELALAQVRDANDKYELIAPFDGILRKIDFQVGDNIVSDEDKYASLQNPNLLQINVLLDQIDIVSVREGQEVAIVFDALPTETFSGMIEEVDPTPVVSSGVVSYTASITIEKGEARIFSGMTASVEIFLAKKEGVPLLPSSALSSRRGKSFVQKMENGNSIETEVETGLVEKGKTEIVSGLSEGDRVLVSDVSAASAGSTSGDSTDAARQFFRATGGGGRPPQ